MESNGATVVPNVFLRTFHSNYVCPKAIYISPYNISWIQISSWYLQANKEHLSTYFRPVPPSLALKQDGQAAWALVRFVIYKMNNCTIVYNCTIEISSIWLAVDFPKWVFMTLPIYLVLLFKFASQALGMQESEYQLAKQGMVAGQVYWTFLTKKNK